MLQAPFILVDKGLLPLDKAWDLVSANPARAAGLMDRGRLEPGRRADLIVVERVAGQAEVRAVFSAGRLVLAGAQAMARIRALGC
jgi:alpha-D-ribose 1-methylphosphonate 5-triphosphate diphosphatase